MYVIEMLSLLLMIPYQPNGDTYERRNGYIGKEAGKTC